MHSTSENNHLCFWFSFSDLSWWVISGLWYFSPVLAFNQIFLFFSWCFCRKVNNRICQDLKCCCQIESITFWWIGSVQLFQERVLFMFSDTAIFLLRSFVQWIIVVSLLELSPIFSRWLLWFLLFLFLSFKKYTPINSFFSWISPWFFQKRIRTLFFKFSTLLLRIIPTSSNNLRWKINNYQIISFMSNSSSSSKNIQFVAVNNSWMTISSFIILNVNFSIFAWY